MGNKQTNIVIPTMEKTTTKKIVTTTTVKEHEIIAGKITTTTTKERKTIVTTVKESKSNIDLVALSCPECYTDLLRVKPMQETKDVPNCNYCARTFAALTANLKELKTYRADRVSPVWKPTDNSNKGYATAFVGSVKTVTPKKGNFCIVARGQSAEYLGSFWHPYVAKKQAFPYDLSVSKSAPMYNTMKKTAYMAIPPKIILMQGTAAPFTSKNDCWLPGGGTQFYIPLPVVHNLWHASVLFLEKPITEESYAEFLRNSVAAFDQQKKWFNEYSIYEQEVHAATIKFNTEREEKAMSNARDAIRQLHQLLSRSGNCQTRELVGKIIELTKIINEAKLIVTKEADGVDIDNMIEAYKNHPIYINIIKQLNQDLAGAKLTLEQWQQIWLVVDKPDMGNALKPRIKSLLINKTESLVDKEKKQSLNETVHVIHKSGNVSVVMDIRLVDVKITTQGPPVTVTTYFYVYSIRLIVIE